jgi:FkbM family methyltransferase
MAKRDGGSTQEQPQPSAARPPALSRRGRPGDLTKKLRMRAPLQKLAYFAYFLARNSVRAVGLNRPLRAAVGPLVGRLVFKTTLNDSRPLTVHGHRMYLACHGGYPPIGMALGQYEAQTTKLFQRIARPGMVVIDVGAHVGYYTLLAARQVGARGKVYAFEPEPANFSLLQQNVALNGYGNVVATKSAVSNRVGPATLFLTSLDSGRHSTHHHGLPGDGTVAVAATTLDAFLQAEGWPAVDLIKVDVEGAELDVLEGMEQLLRKPGELKLIIEFNPFSLHNAGANPIQLLEKLASWQFGIHCIDEKKGVVPLEATGASSLSARLLRRESSVNLFCSRP